MSRRSTSWSAAAGRVIDELVVALPESVSVDLLAKEIGAVDGVAVEHVRAIGDERPDSATALLELAADVAAAPRHDRLGVLVTGLLRAVDGDWAVAVGGGELVARRGTPPDLGWLLAFLDGSGHLDPARPSANAPSDVMWARLPAVGVVVATGRAARAVHERERRRIILLARIVDGLLGADYAKASSPAATAPLDVPAESRRARRNRPGSGRAGGRRSCPVG